MTVHEGCIPPLLGSLDAMEKFGNFRHGRRIRYQEKVCGIVRRRGRREHDPLTLATQTGASAVTAAVAGGG